MSDAAGRICVLLLEDNDGDARLIEIELAESGPGRPVDVSFEVERASTLTAGLAMAASHRSDVALLDLNLPDSFGIDTFVHLHKSLPGLPVVVLSGLEDEELGARAVREGAQDYLVKGRVDGAVLARALRFAVERRRVEAERAERLRVESALEEARRVEEQLRDELAGYERLAAPAPAAVTGATFGVKPIRQALPDRFAGLVEEYAGLLDRALERRAYRIEDRLSDALRSLAEQIGFVRGGPRDVVELHTAALRSRIEGAHPKKSRAYVDEGRVAILELMGHLVAYYRR